MAAPLNKSGNDPGAAIQTVLIPATLVPLGDQAKISDVDVQVRSGATDSIVILQMSNDGFVLNVVEKTRVEMPVGGNFLKSYNNPQVIPGGYEYRVVFSQTITGEISCNISGVVENLMDPQLGTQQIDL